MPEHPPDRSPRSAALRLAYHPPLDWAGMLRFLGARLLKGVEWIERDAYHRTVRLGDLTGSVRVRHLPEGHSLLVEPSPSLLPVLPALLDRLRHLFDLGARPDVIAAHLARDPLLAGAVSLNPGLRVPGAFDGFELGVRAVLGQQVTVKAATTIAGRFAEAFGEPVELADGLPARLSPTPGRIAEATVDEIASLGIIRTRAQGILALAQAVHAGRLTLEPSADPAPTIVQLVALPGIGRWTAQYIAMRALRWADAFPREDVALLKRLGGVTPAQAEARSEAWRPWRSYALVHLWQVSSPTP